MYCAYLVLSELQVNSNILNPRRRKGWSRTSDHRNAQVLCSDQKSKTQTKPTFGATLNRIPTHGGNSPEVGSRQRHRFAQQRRAWVGAVRPIWSSKGREQIAVTVRNCWRSIRIRSQQRWRTDSDNAIWRRGRRTRFPSSSNQFPAGWIATAVRRTSKGHASRSGPLALRTQWDYSPKGSRSSEHVWLWSWGCPDAVLQKVTQISSPRGLRMQYRNATWGVGPSPRSRQRIDEIIHRTQFAEPKERPIVCPRVCEPRVSPRLDRAVPQDLSEMCPKGIQLWQPGDSRTNDKHLGHQHGTFYPILRGKDSIRDHTHARWTPNDTQGKS